MSGGRSPASTQTSLTPPLRMLAQPGPSFWQRKVPSSRTGSSKVHPASNMAPLPVPVEVPTTPNRKCPYCSIEFSFLALGTHMFRAHGKKNDVRQMIAGTSCLACMKQYNTRSKLLHHVSFRSAHCEQYYLHTIIPMPAEAYDKAEADTAKARTLLKRQGRSPQYSPLPVVRLIGPTPPPPLLCPPPPEAERPSSIPED